MTPVNIFQAEPGVEPLPLICDSPHSGTHYPADFRYAVDLALLRQSEDTHVDTLWSGVPKLGGSLICATFPRSYIDPNREHTDVDVAMLQGDWPHRAEPSRLCLEQGNGLVWRLTPEYEPIYDRLLSPEELAARIDGYWKPYRSALTEQLCLAQERFGGWCHLNLHSMPSNAYERLRRPPQRLADVVLGDLDGSTCSLELRELVAEAFKKRGYSVSANDPYKGQDLIRTWGNPVMNRHSLQIEINRTVYMNEKTREPNERFASLKSDIDQVLLDLVGFVRDIVARR